MIRWRTKGTDRGYEITGYLDGSKYTKIVQGTSEFGAAFKAIEETLLAINPLSSPVKPLNWGSKIPKKFRRV